MSLFWRISAGTLLGVAGMVAATLYQHFNTSLNELRADLKQLNAAAGETAKRDEVRSRFSTLWTSVKELSATSSTLAAQQVRWEQLEQQVRASEKERKELVRELQRLRERLASVEGRQAALTPAAPAHRAEEP
jgi:chromosome segregation ATPase